MRLYCWLSLLALVSLRLPAQQQYLFSRLGVHDGLVSNTAMAVAQDEKGFIWIATMGGLQRYDGHRFLLFQHQPGDPASLPNNQVLQLRLDKRNRLWVLCQNNKLGFIDPEALHYHPVPVSIPDEILGRAEGNFHIDHEGHILFFLGRLATLAYDESTQTFSAASLPFALPPGWLAHGIFEDTNTGAYYLTCDSGMVKYDPARHTLSYGDHNADHDPVIGYYGKLPYPSLPYRDGSGRFWLSTWPPDGSGLSIFTFDPDTHGAQEWHSRLSNLLHNKYHEVHAIHEQKDGTLWFAGVNTLVLLRKNGHDFERVLTNPSGEFGLYYDNVHDLFEDREGSIWLATDKGVYHFNPLAQLFHTISNKRTGKDTIYTPDVTGILQARNGNILVSTWGNGLFVYDSSFHPIDTWYGQQSRQLKESLTWCILERANGDLWRGQQHGWLYISHAATRRTDSIHPPVFHNSTIRQIVEDSKGDCWLGTQSGELVKWDAATNTYAVLQSLGSSVIRLYLDWKKDLWACTLKDGLFRIRTADGTILHHYSKAGPSAEALPSIRVDDILQCSDSLYAVACDNLVLIDQYTGVIRQVDHAAGIPFEGITNIARDELGYLWATTRDGLCKLNMHHIIRNVFNEEDGIGSSAFNPGTSCRLKDGRIAFGTVHDIVFFQPVEVARGNRKPPEVEITGIAVDNKWLPPDSLARLKQLELPYDENSVRITFSTLAYFSAFGISYQMEGLDKEWITRQSSEAIYNYLPPGHYTFRIYARNSDDAVSPLVRELSITVKSPFWRTWWFLCFILLAAATFLYWLDRQRMQRKAAMEKIRSDISDNLLEEVNKALQNINVLSEIARIKAGKDPEQSINYINEIHHKSHNMIIAMDDMLWTIDPANDNMARAVDRMKEFAEALTHRHDVRIRMQAAENVDALQPDMKIRHELLLIYKLILRVLVEETNAPDTLVELGQERGLLHMNIYSGGVRIDLRNGRSIRLLEEARARTAAIHGTLDRQSDEKGTAILFICPSTF